MANQNPRNLSLYFHHATAFGLAGHVNRPSQQPIPTQASVMLAPTGGHSTDRVDKYELPGIVSFSSASVDVGGSFDETNSTHTTYASSVIEDLNIFNIVLADRIVSRLTIYHPSVLTNNPTAPGNQPPASSPSNTPNAATPNAAGNQSSTISAPEMSFSIDGSHFDNLRINGQKIDAELDTKTFHDSTYNNFCNNSTPNQRASLLGSNIDLSKLSPTDHNYAVVKDIADRFNNWNPNKNQPMQGHHFWCSATNYLIPPPQPSVPPPTPASGLVNFGGIICVPRFGVVHLAELLIHRNHRHLTMIRVHMCSPGEGFIGGGGTGGGGGGTMPPT